MANSHTTIGTVRNLGGDLLAAAVMAAMLGVATLWCSAMYDGSFLGDAFWAAFYWDFGVYSIVVAVVLAVMGGMLRLATE